MPAAPQSETIALLDACAARSIALELGADGALKVRAPAGALTPELQAALRARKADLIALLGAGAAAPIPRAPRTGPLPLASAQARLWFLSQLDPQSSAAYNIVVAVRIRGPLRADLLEGAVNGLRTTFLKEKIPWNYLVAFAFLGVAAFFAFAFKAPVPAA